MTNENFCLYFEQSSFKVPELQFAKGGGAKFVP
jgi:hypothetical protein